MNGEELSFFDVFTQGTYGFFVFGILVVLFILSILWIILPFAVFKIKSILGDTNIQLMRMNNYLMSIEGHLQNIAKEKEIKDLVTPAVPVNSEPVKESAPTDNNIISTDE